MSEPISCSPRFLAEECHDDAALAAINENPLNAPHVHGLVSLVPGIDQSSIAMVTSKYWRTAGVRLTVGFLDDPEPALRERILAHMNAWSKTGNIEFVYSRTEPQVRIARDQPGYWSYIGTDVLLIDAAKPTMNLQGFTMNTPDREFFRVVRHETGHTLGCPHEHMRADLIDLIDATKAIAYFGATQGWSPAQVRAQVLTPLDERSILGTPTDQCSIMCYHIPGHLTKNGQAILGGVDIDDSDYGFIGKIYPKPASPGPAASVINTSTAASHGDAAAGEVRIDMPNGTRLHVCRHLSLSQIERLARALGA